LSPYPRKQELQVEVEVHVWQLAGQDPEQTPLLRTTPYAHEVQKLVLVDRQAWQDDEHVVQVLVAVLRILPGRQDLQAVVLPGWQVIQGAEQGRQFPFWFKENPGIQTMHPLGLLALQVLQPGSQAAIVNPP
jgi:hypothetical protein